MVLTVTRKLKLNKFIYSLNNDEIYSGESNFTFGLLLRKIFVCDKNNQCTYKLVQKNIFYKLLYLGGLWLLPISLFPEYKLYLNDECIGKTKVSISSPRRFLSINDDIFELCIHSNNYISIMKNNVQIALVKKILLQKQNRTLTKSVMTAA